MAQRVVAVVFSGAEGKPRYIPGIGSKGSVHVDQRTASGALVSRMEMDPTGQSVLVWIVDTNGQPVKTFDKTADYFMLHGDFLGIPIGNGTVIYEYDKQAVEKKDKK